MEITKDKLNHIKNFCSCNSNILCMVYGALISALVSFLVLSIQISNQKKVLIYEKELHDLLEIKDAATDVIIVSYPDYLIDVATMLSDGRYKEARNRVSQQYDDFNTAIVKFNVTLRTYKGTNDEIMNMFSDNISTFALFHSAILNLMQKMCLFINSAYDFEHFGKHLDSLNPSNDDERFLIDGFCAAVDKNSTIIPTLFTKYLIEAHNLDDGDSIDKLLMIQIGETVNSQLKDLEDKYLH